MAERIILGAEYSILEPLALYYLASIAKSEGLEQKIILGRGPDYKEWREQIQSYNPSYIGLTVYTGNHLDIGRFLKEVKKTKPELKVIVGGPHATYFPKQTLEFSDYVVVGEGFDSFRRIIRKEASPGIILPSKREPFPLSFREDFYKENPKHKENRIKNVIANSGCPFSCSHCYNSARMEDNPDFSKEQLASLKKLYSSGKFFPICQRPVKDVVDEIARIKEISPETGFLFIEDDIFGMDVRWMREFAKEYSHMIPFHANMRFEFVDPRKDSGREKIYLLKEAGCTGLSFAIESASPVICKEVLGRNTDNELIFSVMEAMNKAELKVRTYQMIGLPYGATIKPTKINLDADLETLELNVKLREKTGLPTFVWASTLAPYPGTQIANYCSKHGFYQGNFNDLAGEETYRIRSVLRHPKKWTGPDLSSEMDVWLSHDEQESYKDKLMELMNYFPIFAYIPDGHNFARKFLSKEISQDELNNAITTYIPNGQELMKKFIAQKDHSTSALNKAIRTHIYDNILFL